jgi:hypothetical protein
MSLRNKKQQRKTISFGKTATVRGMSSQTESFKLFKPTVYYKKGNQKIGIKMKALKVEALIVDFFHHSHLPTEISKRHSRSSANLLRISAQQTCGTKSDSV